MANSLNIVAVLKTHYPVSEEEAITLYPSLEDAVKSDSELVLSFKEVDTCSSIFLNKLLGKLYLNFGAAVDDHIKYDIDKDNSIIPDQIDRIRKKALRPGFYRPIFENAVS